MTPITNPTYLFGLHNLPAGAVPLASDKPGSVVCQTPPGRWIRWWPGTRSIEALPPSTQKKVMVCLVGHFGKRSKMAEALDVSPRTIDAWRMMVQPLPVKAAERIARLLAE